MFCIKTYNHTHKFTGNVSMLMWVEHATVGTNTVLLGGRGLHLEYHDVISRIRQFEGCRHHISEGTCSNQRTINYI